MAHRYRMDHHKRLSETKQAALHSITRLEKLAVGASPSELSIIEKLIIVARNNIKMAEAEFACRQIIANARAKAA